MSALARQQAIADSPALAPIVAQYPVGTGTTANALIDNYNTVRSLAVEEDTGSFKIDHTFSEKDTMFFRFNMNEGDVNGPLCSTLIKRTRRERSSNGSELVQRNLRFA